MRRTRVVRCSACETRACFKPSTGRRPTSLSKGHRDLSPKIPIRIPPSRGGSLDLPSEGIDGGGSGGSSVRTFEKGTWEDGSWGIDRKGRIGGNGRWGCSMEGSRTNGRAGRRRAGGGEEEALPYDGNPGRSLGQVGRGDEWRPLKLSNENVERVVGNKNGCQATHECTSVSSSFEGQEGGSMWVHFLALCLPTKDWFRQDRRGDADQPSRTYQ